jgi:hypothetical protein
MVIWFVPEFEYSIINQIILLDCPAITLEHLTLIADNHHGAQDLDQYAGFLKFPLGAMG